MDGATKLHRRTAQECLSFRFAALDMRFTASAPALRAASLYHARRLRNRRIRLRATVESGTDGCA